MPQRTAMTYTELGVTHILEDSPRGFANEVSVIPVTRPYALLAAERMEAINDDPNAWGWFGTWDEATPGLRRKAGLQLRDLASPEALDRWLTELFLSDFAADPHAFDLVDGQWQRRKKA